MKLTLHLIRHGESTGNLIRQLQSVLDTKLTENGYDQARQLQGKLDLDVVYHSPLTRAAETARTIFGDTNTELIQRTNLHEIDIGVLVGKLYPELSEEEKDLFNRTETDPNFKGHDGESHNEFRNRLLIEMKNIVKDMKEREIQECGVVTHGGVLQDFLQKYLGIKEASLQNCVVHKVEYDTEVNEWNYIEQLY